MVVKKPQTNQLMFCGLPRGVDAALLYFETPPPVRRAQFNIRTYFVAIINNISN